MRLSDDTHDYLCTECRQRGGPCLEALWLSQRVARTLAARAAELPEGFELVSQTRFNGCARDCTVDLRVTGQAVEVASGPDDRLARVKAERRLDRALAVGG